MVGDDGKTVPWRDERVGAVDHVAVSVTITSCPEVDIVLIDCFDEGVGIGQVRIGVPAIEIRRWNAVLGAGAWETELCLEDGLAIRASDARKGIEEDLKIGMGLEEFLDQGEIENFLQHLYIVCA